MAEKRKRAPGGGRKSLDPDEAQSVKVMVRVRPALRDQLLELAKKHRKEGRPNLSVEIRLALRHWIDRHEISHVHNSALATAIAVLADRIEDITDKTWVDDPMTREVVRDRVVKLVRHTLTPLSKRVTIPKDIKEDADLVLKLLKHAMPRPGYVAPRFWEKGTVIIDDRGLANLIQHLAQHLGERRVNIETRPELVARREQDEKAWTDAVRTATEAAFTAYVQKFPYGRRVTQARERLAAFNEQRGREAKP